MDSVDIQHLAELWGTDVTRVGEKEIQMRCPFAPFGGHKSNVDRNPNFSIRVSAGPSVCHCFSCSKGGLVLHVAHQLWMLSEEDGRYRDAYRFVKKTEEAIPFEPKVPEKKNSEIQTDDSLDRIMRMARGTISSVLKKRGITDADIRKWDLGFDTLNQRDVFPIYDVRKRLVAITGRRITDEQYPKYWSGYGQHPENITRVFYGEHLLDLTVSEGILVEGPLDTIATSRQYPNVLGQCGVATITAERRRRLKQWFSAVTFLYDADAAGSVGMFKVGLDLFKHLTLFAAFLPDGLDPFDATPTQRAKAIQERVLWSLVDWGEKGAPSTT